MHLDVSSSCQEITATKKIWLSWKKMFILFTRWLLVNEIICSYPTNIFKFHIIIRYASINIKFNKLLLASIIREVNCSIVYLSQGK